MIPSVSTPKATKEITVAAIRAMISQSSVRRCTA